MPRDDLKTCRGCGSHVDECGPLSHSRLCVECGVTRSAQALEQMVSHDGPVFQHWRARIAASVGAVLSERQTDRVSDA